MTSKEKLVEEAVDMKLGDKAFLSSLKEENLTGMVEAVRIRDGKIKDNQKVISSGKAGAKIEGVTTVGDLVRAGKIDVNKVKTAKAVSDKDTEAKLAAAKAKESKEK